MYNQIICVFLLVQFYFILGKKRGEPCTTSNNKQGTCVAVYDCKVIFDAITTKNSAAIEFARQSLCGHDSIPLLCCDTNGSYFLRPSKMTSSINVEMLNALPNRTICGLEKTQHRVLGGQIVYLDGFPWVAALEFKFKLSGKNAGIRCGGSLINNEYVLTAADCILNAKIELISVWLGDWKLSTDPDCDHTTGTECSTVLKLKAKEQLPHPYYHKKTKTNNIGLIRLERNIEFTDYIRPICLLPIKSPSLPPNTALTLAGWSITEEGPSSDFKLSVDVPLLDNNTCTKKLGSFDLISLNYVCAGEEEGTHMCQGDPGGPVMIKYLDSNISPYPWFLEGVIGKGVNCVRPGIPAIYTRISSHINWIVNTISEDM